MGGQNPANETSSGMCNDAGTPGATPYGGCPQHFNQVEANMKLRLAIDRAASGRVGQWSSVGAKLSVLSETDAPYFIQALVVIQILRIRIAAEGNFGVEFGGRANDDVMISCSVALFS